MSPERVVLEQQVPDPLLIERVRNGDKDAATELYSRYRRKASGAARALSGKPSDEEDLVAESFARVFERIDAGHGPREAFLPYLYATMRNLVTDSRRRPAPSPTERDELCAVIDSLPRQGPNVVIDSVIVEQQQILNAFRQLPERWRDVLWHQLVEDEPLVDIAGKLGMSQKAVSAIAFRARRRFRQVYLEAERAQGIPRTVGQARRGADRSGALSGMLVAMVFGSSAEAFTRVQAVERAGGASAGSGAGGAGGSGWIGNFGLAGALTLVVGIVACLLGVVLQFDDEAGIPALASRSGSEVVTTPPGPTPSSSHETVPASGGGAVSEGVDIPEGIAQVPSAASSSAAPLPNTTPSQREPVTLSMRREDRDGATRVRIEMGESVVGRASFALEVSGNGLLTPIGDGWMVVSEVSASGEIVGAQRWIEMSIAAPPGEALDGTLSLSATFTNDAGRVVTSTLVNPLR